MLELTDEFLIAPFSEYGGIGFTIRRAIPYLSNHVLGRMIELRQLCIDRGDRQVFELSRALPDKAGEFESQHRYAVRQLSEEINVLKIALRTRDPL